MWFTQTALIRDEEDDSGESAVHNVACVDE